MTLRATDREPRSDGGRTQTVEEILFDPDEEVALPVTRFERIKRLVDYYVVAPFRVMISDWRAVIGLTIITGFFLIGIFGPTFIKEPVFNEGSPYIQPFTNSNFPFGTDGYGQSIFKELIHATPAMIKMVIAGAVVSTAIGTVFGTVAGYKGGTIDTVLMTLTDIVATIPGLVLIIVIASAWPPKDPFVVGMLLAIDNWPGLSRGLRSQVLTIRQESYVESSRAMGLPSRRILSKDIVPQLMPLILISAAGAGRGVIFESVGLYFLGILPFSISNWGVMLNTAYNRGAAISNLNHFYWMFFPMLAIVIVSFGLILFSQGMDRVFNARLRAKHAKSVSDEGEESVQ
jgi:peptide/nickel transport system permease protein